MLLGPHVDRVWATGAARPPITAHIDAACKDKTTAAIFVSNPRARAITLTDAEAAELRKSARHIVAHSTYTATPWAMGNAECIAYVAHELRVCARAGIRGLVVHLTKSTPAVAAESVQAIRHAYAAGAAGAGAASATTNDVIPTLFLETPAITAAGNHYNTPEKLGVLFALISSAPASPGAPPVGLCVDTAHLWTSGIDLRSRDAAAAWIAGLRNMAAAHDAAAAHAVDARASPEAAAAPAKLQIMYHLNDSKNPLGVGPDSHEALGAGHIWRGLAPRESGLAAFVADADRHGSVAILERKPIELLESDYAYVAAARK